MKPSRIKDMLDIAMQARKANKTFIPNFAGAAGIGKSEICQGWVNDRKKTNPKFQFIDLRVAYLEAPDFIGYPGETKDAQGVMRTSHRLPEFWPTDPDSQGLILFEEPNRGTTAVMNCLMQILTDRKVHNYSLPKGWIMAAAINPDSPEYDVQAMDQALRDRFVTFEVEYDHNSFVEFMEQNKYDPKIQAFVKSGAWVYKDSSSLAKGAMYIAPRTWSRVNAAHAAGALEDRQVHYAICQAVLGKDIGGEFWKFCHDDAPVMANDLINNKDAALKKLKQHTKTGHYQGDKVSVTVESIIANYGGTKDTNDKGEKLVSEEIMVEVARIIPSDQAVALIRGCGIKSHNGNITNFFKDFTKKYPELLDILKSNIKLSGNK